METLKEKFLDIRKDSLKLPNYCKLLKKRGAKKEVLKFLIALENGFKSKNFRKIEKEAGSFYHYLKAKDNTLLKMASSGENAARIQFVITDLVGKTRDLQLSARTKT
jgi:ERCC4-type nuclease